MAISPNAFSNVIDCDIHPTVPSLNALLPYMNEHWKDTIVQRGVHELETISYPKNAPLTVRPDWRLEKGVPASNVDLIKKQALDPFGTSIAVLNCLYGVQLLMSEDMASSFASAVNDWIKAEFLDIRSGRATWATNLCTRWKYLQTPCNICWLALLLYRRLCI